MELLFDGQFERELYDAITALKDTRGKVALLHLGDF